MDVTVYESVRELPESHRALLHEAERWTYCAGIRWFENFAATSLAPGDRVRFYSVAGPGAVPHVILPAHAADLPWMGGTTRFLGSLTNYYSCHFALAVARDIDGLRAPLDELVGAIREETPAWERLRFDSFDRDSVQFTEMQASMRRHGYATQPFFHFGNWYEPVAGRDFDLYWRERPSALRNTVRRRGRRLEREVETRFRLYADAAQAHEGLAAYQAVYRMSWKAPEPFPEFTSGLIRTAAQAGTLRLGVLYAADVPVAAQVWLLSHGKATIFKLAYDEAYKRYSVGSILTARIMRHVLDEDRVSEVDFGRGDDAYKRDWLSKRRERWGFLAFNPRTFKGLLGAARHVGGYRAKRALRGVRPGSAHVDE